MEIIQVLFVEDQAVLRNASKTYLEEFFDFSVDTASDGDEALKKLEEKKYDAIVSDYDMPNLNGIELLKRIRENNSKIPFIIFTGKSREEVAIEALNNGADYYLQKGGDISSLYEILSGQIKKAVSLIRSEEERLDLLADIEELVNACPHAAVIINPDFTIRFINEFGKKYLYEFYNYSGEFFGKSLKEIFRENTAEEKIKEYKKTLDDHNPIMFIREVKGVLFEGHITPHFNSSGKLRFYSYFLDKLFVKKIT